MSRHALDCGQRNNRPFRLVDRDLILLRHCCEFGYLTAKQINENFIFVKKQVLCRRLSKLVQSGLLVTKSQLICGKTYLVYCPNIQNLVGVLEKYHIDYAIRTVAAKKWNCSYGEHEDEVRNWALKIKRLFPEVQIDLDVMLIRKNIKSDSQWLEEYKKLPDFTIHYKDKPKISVEIELSSKSEERYVSRFLALMSQPNNTTLYLVRDNKILKPILNSLKLATEKLKNKNYIQLSNILYFTFEQIISPQKMRSVFEHIWQAKVMTGLMTQSSSGEIAI
jgi:hypothetical protein